MKSMDDNMLATRKANTRKPKVAPVMGSKVKMDKMLKKQMDALSLSGSSKAMKARKLDMQDDSSSGDEDDEGMEGVSSAALVPRIGNGFNNSRIAKRKGGLSRAEEQRLKKEIRRRMKIGSKDARKDAKKLKNRMEEGMG